MELQTVLDSKNEEIAATQQKLTHALVELADKKNEKTTLELENLKLKSEIEELRTELTQKKPGTAPDQDQSKMQDIEALKNYYISQYKQQETDYKKILEEIDKLLLDQEHEIEQLKRENLQFSSKEKEYQLEIASLKAELPQSKDTRTKKVQYVTVSCENRFR